MSFAKLIELEARLKRQEEENAGLRSEIESLRIEQARLVDGVNALTKAHNVLADEYVATERKLREYLVSHEQDHKNLSVLVGNTCNEVFPKMADAIEEIDRAIGLIKPIRSN